MQKKLVVYFARRLEHALKMANDKPAFAEDWLRYAKGVSDQAWELVR